MEKKLGIRGTNHGCKEGRVLSKTPIQRISDVVARVEAGNPEMVI